MHAAVGFQTRSGESRKERNKKKKSPGGFGVEHPPRLRHTLAFGGCFYLSVPQFRVRGSHGCSDLSERVSEGFQTFNRSPE